MMDINMPQMDGHESKTRIRELEEQFEVAPQNLIACSAVTANEFGNPEEQGFSGFLPKPFPMQSLRSLLEKL